MDILEDICNVVTRNAKCNPKIEISLDTRFVEDLGFDSLRMMQFFTDLEDEFDILLPDIDISQMKRVRDVELMLTRRKLICA